MIYLRHTEKDSVRTDQASQAGLDLFKTIMIPRIELTTDIFVSEIGRTAQTALAAVVHMGLTKVERVHAAIKEIGCDEQIKMIFAAGYLEARARTADGLSAMEVCLGKTAYLDLQQTLLAGVTKAFDAMPKGGRGLVVGHSPFIEAVVEIIGGNPGRDLECCHGFVLMQDDAGTISVLSRF